MKYILKWKKNTHKVKEKGRNRKDYKINPKNKAKLHKSQICTDLKFHTKHQQEKETETERKQREDEESDDFCWCTASSLFWRCCRHISDNNSDPYRTADVFLISPCSARETPNVVCIFATVQENKISVELIFSPRSLCSWKCSPSHAKSLSSISSHSSGSHSKFVAKSERFVKELEGVPQGTILGTKSSFWRFFENQLLL